MLYSLLSIACVKIQGLSFVSCDVAPCVLKYLLLLTSAKLLYVSIKIACFLWLNWCLNIQSPIFMFSASPVESAVWTVHVGKILFYYFARLCTGKIGNGTFVPLWDGSSLSLTIVAASVTCIKIRAVRVQRVQVQRTWHCGNRNRLVWVDAWHWRVHCKICPCGWCRQPCMWRVQLETALHS